MRIVREFIVPRRPLPTIPRLNLVLFVAALHARTLKMRDHHGAQWKRLLDIAERGAPEDGRIEWRDGTTDPNAPSYIHVDDIRELVENPMPTTVHAATDAKTPRMMQMHARILCIESETGFQPCCDSPGAEILYTARKISEIDAARPPAPDSAPSRRGQYQPTGRDS